MIDINLKRRAFCIILLSFAITDICTRVESDEHEYEPEDEFSQGDYEDEELNLYAQQLADFQPGESFQFQLMTSEQQTFIFWPPPETKMLRGLFYLISEAHNGLFVGCECDGVMQKTYYDQKIGVFNIPYHGTGDMKLIFKSEITELEVYVSYEIVIEKESKKISVEGEKGNTGGNEEQGEEEQGQLEKVAKKFQQVRQSLSGQQQILKAILKGSSNEIQGLQAEIASKSMKAVVETFAVVISGIFSLYMLKKQLKNGYQVII